MRHRVYVQLTLFVILLSGVFVIGSAQENPPGPVAWLSNRDGDYEVFLWDGIETRQLTANTGTDRDPIRSSMGLYAWELSGNQTSEIYLWDGEQVRNLSENPEADFNARWSRDGRLTWWSQQQGELVVAIWDGRTIQYIGQGKGWAKGIVPYWSWGGATIDEPAWSSDGQKLAWHGSQDDKTASIYIWDTTGVHEIASDLPLGTHLAWSADGRLAWTSGDWTSRAEFYTLYVWDGTSVVSLDDYVSISDTFLWSPDGKLAWISERDGNNEVYVWDGRQTRNLSQTPTVREWQLQWSTYGQLTWNSNSSLFLWDQNQVRVLTNHRKGFADWSLRGELAWIAEENGAEGVYLWDAGQTTLLSSTLSAGSVLWSDDGRLAWVVGQESHYSLYVWDRATIREVASEIKSFFALRWVEGWLVWSNDSDIYVWDGRQTRNVSSDPAHDTFELPVGSG